MISAFGKSKVQPGKDNWIAAHDLSGTYCKVDDGLGIFEVSEVYIQDLIEEFILMSAEARVKLQRATELIGDFGAGLRDKYKPCFS